MLTGRKEKREALTTARSNLRLGGTKAMYAALALLTAEGAVMVEQNEARAGRGQDEKAR